MISVRFVLLFILTVVLASEPAMAQKARKGAPQPTAATVEDHSRIAAVVNDSVITAQDLERRVRLAMALSNIADTPEARAGIVPQVLRKMIDEKLQNQEGKRLNLSISSAEVDERIAAIEHDSGIPAGGLSKGLKEAGLDPESFRDQMRSDITWAKLVVQTMGPQIRIGDDEINTRLNQLKSKEGTPEYLTAEIFLPVDHASQDSNVQKLAHELLGHMQRGAPFSTLARQFSRAPSSGAGGMLGWISEGMIDPQLFAAVKDTAKGQANVVKTPGGYYIIAVLDRRISGQAMDINATQITLSQMTLPLPPNYDPNKFPMEALLQRAGQLASQATSCSAFERLGRQLDGKMETIGPVSLASLGKQVGELVQAVPAGSIARPFAIKEGVRILMVCDRHDVTTSALPDKDHIRNALEDERMEILGRRYLRDLRRAAFIDIRM